MLSYRSLLLVLVPSARILSAPRKFGSGFKCILMQTVHLASLCVYSETSRRRFDKLGAILATSNGQILPKDDLVLFFCKVSILGHIIRDFMEKCDAKIT
jgi:hypothetical protein